MNLREIMIRLFVVSVEKLDASRQEKGTIRQGAIDVIPAHLLEFFDSSPFPVHKGFRSFEGHEPRHHKKPASIAKFPGLFHLFAESSNQ